MIFHLLSVIVFIEVEHDICCGSNYRVSISSPLYEHLPLTLYISFHSGRHRKHFARKTHINHYSNCDCKLTPRCSYLLTCTQQQLHGWISIECISSDFFGLEWFFRFYSLASLSVYRFRRVLVEWRSQMRMEREWNLLHHQIFELNGLLWYPWI